MMDYGELIKQLCNFGYKDIVLHDIEQYLDGADFISARVYIKDVYDGIEKELAKQFQEGWKLSLSYMTLRDKNTKESEALIRLLNSYQHKEELPEHIIIKISDMVDEFADRLTYGLIRQRPLSEEEIADLLPKLIVEIQPKFNSYYEKLVKDCVITLVQELGGD